MESCKENYLEIKDRREEILRDILLGKIKVKPKTEKLGNLVDEISKSIEMLKKKKVKS